MSKLTPSFKLGLLVVFLSSVKVVVLSTSEKEPMANANSTAQDAFHAFKNLPIDKKDAPESERVSAFVMKLEKIRQFLPLLETWKKEVENSTTLTSEQKTQFNDAFTKVTSESIDGAIKDVKADKPSFEKAEAVRSSVVACSRIQSTAVKAAQEAQKEKSDAAQATKEVKDTLKEEKKAVSEKNKKSKKAESTKPTAK